MPGDDPPSGDEDHKLHTISGLRDPKLPANDASSSDDSSKPLPTISALREKNNVVRDEVVAGKRSPQIIPDHNGDDSDASSDADSVDSLEEAMKRKAASLVDNNKKKGPN